MVALERAVALDPDEGQGRCQLAKWTASTSTSTSARTRGDDSALEDEDGAEWRTAPLDDAYVTGLFDQFASTFEDTLVGDLSYRGHLQCASILKRALPKEALELASRTRSARVVDLGAGTGLCGGPVREALAPAAAHVVAVDLAANMLNEARAKGTYDDVVVSEGLAYLRTRVPDAALDVIVAADVFAYVGDCAPLFAQATRCLKPSGRFVFTLEEQAAGFGQDAGFGLNDGGRFAHSETYLRQAAKDARLDVLLLDRAQMRTQKGKSVVALVAALGPAAPAPSIPPDGP